MFLKVPRVESSAFKVEGLGLMVYKTVFPNEQAAGGWPPPLQGNLAHKKHTPYDPTEGLYFGPYGGPRGGGGCFP